jgi:hypothetical protein
MSIKYVKGDATVPQGTGRKLIIHICNDMGGWGSGFVIAVSKRWDAPEMHYRALAERAHTLGNFIQLGEVQFVEVGDNIIIGNMIAQHMTQWIDGVPPIRYDALSEALDMVAHYALKHGCTVHGPRFGSALAGGDWDRIAALVEKKIVSKGIDVTIYDFPDAEDFKAEIERRKSEVDLHKDMM